LEHEAQIDESPPPSSASFQGLAPQGEGLGKALTTITSQQQKLKYILTGVVLSVFGFFVANIPMGTATLVVGRILLRNQIKGWGYLFCIIGTVWAVGLPILNLLSLIETSAISIIPRLPKF
jgi:hypothetical protein